MAKKQLIITIASFCMLLFCMTGITFAWYLKGDNINGLFFKTTKINSTVMLYSVSDSNFNGMPDENPYTAIGLPEQVRSAENEAEVNKTMQIAGFMPTQIRMFKVEITNYSERTNTIRFAFASGPNVNTFSKYIALYSAKIVVLDTDGLTPIVEKDVEGNDVIFNKSYFYQALNESPNYFINSEMQIGASYIAGATIEENPVKSFWLQFEFETYENLCEQFEGFESYITYAEYQSSAELFGANILTLPFFKVYLEI